MEVVSGSIIGLLDLGSVIRGFGSLGLGDTLSEVELGGAETELGAESLNVGSLELVADVGSVDTEGASLGFVGKLSAVNTELGLGSPDTKLGAGSSNSVVNLGLSVSEGTVRGDVVFVVDLTVSTVGFTVTNFLGGGTVGSLLLGGGTVGSLLNTVRVLTVRVLTVSTEGFLLNTVRVLTVSTEVGFAERLLAERLLAESGADVTTEG